MQTGKLTNEQLDRLIFSKLKSTRAETVTGPGVGRDCAVADLGENYLVLSTDPITGTEKGIGRLCVNISCNDVAAAGGEPVAILVTMLIPPRAQMAQVEEVVDLSLIHIFIKSKISFLISSSLRGENTTFAPPLFISRNSKKYLPSHNSAIKKAFYTPSKNHDPKCMDVLVLFKDRMVPNCLL